MKQYASNVVRYGRVRKKVVTELKVCTGEIDEVGVCVA